MQKLTCIICPNGCALTVDDEGKISGNICKRGEEFAKEEITNPQRSLTSTCKTVYKDIPVIPVRSDGPLPKGLISEAIKEVNKIVIDKPLGIGSIIIENILNTNVNIILSSNALKEKE